LLTWILAVLVCASAPGQTPVSPPQLVLENDTVRVSKITLPAHGHFTFDEKADAVMVRLSDESGQFMAGGHIAVDNSTDLDATDILISLKNHWDAEVRPCSFPRECTRETQMGGQAIAQTTTLFTNGFVTAAVHRLVPGGTLDSSYYTAKGSDRIVVIPFTALDASFDGTPVNLKSGDPYFSSATQVEVTARDHEARWFVLRLNLPKP